MPIQWPIKHNKLNQDHFLFHALTFIELIVDSLGSQKHLILAWEPQSLILPWAIPKLDLHSFFFFILLETMTNKK